MLRDFAGKEGHSVRYTLHSTLCPLSGMHKFNVKIYHIEFSIIGFFILRAIKASFQKSELINLKLFENAISRLRCLMVVTALEAFPIKAHPYFGNIQRTEVNFNNPFGENLIMRIGSIPLSSIRMNGNNVGIWVEVFSSLV